MSFISAPMYKCRYKTLMFFISISMYKCGSKILKNSASKKSQTLYYDLNYAYLSKEFYTTLVVAFLCISVDLEFYKNSASLKEVCKSQELCCRSKRTLRSL